MSVQSIEHSIDLDPRLNGYAAEPLREADAINLFKSMKEQLDIAIFEEDPAKEAVINALALQKNIALGGIAGAGKSTLARAAFRLVKGVTPDQFAFVPGSPDLRVGEITGQKIEHEKSFRTLGQDDEQTQVITAKPKGAFNENTVIGQYEELTAANLRAIRGSMSILEDGTLETTEGPKKLEHLLAVILCMNTARRQDGTHELPNQVLSRVGAGAYMGKIHEDREARMKHNREVRNRGAKPELLVNGVATPSQFRALNHYIMHSVALDSKIEDKMDNIIVDAAEYIRDQHEVEETDNRLNKMITQNVKAYAARNAGGVANEENLFDATRSVIAARIAPKQSANEIDLDKDVANIVKL